MDLFSLALVVEPGVCGGEVERPRRRWPWRQVTRDLSRSQLTKAGHPLGVFPAASCAAKEPCLARRASKITVNGPAATPALARLTVRCKGVSYQVLGLAMATIEMCIKSSIGFIIKFYKYKR